MELRYGCFNGSADSTLLAGCQRRTLTARSTHVGHENGTRMGGAVVEQQFPFLAHLGPFRVLT
jgi:hypothetical protein